MAQYDDVEKAVIEVAETITAIDAKEHWPSDRIWTKRLLTALGELGYKRGLTPPKSRRQSRQF